MDEQIPKEVNRRFFEVLEKIVDKARDEPEWKDKFLSDPKTAFAESGLVREIGDVDTAEVMGQMSDADVAAALLQMMHESMKSIITNYRA